MSLKTGFRNNTSYNNYNAHVCKEVSLKHSTCKYKLGISNYDLEDEVFELWP